VGREQRGGAYRFAVPLHMPARIPAALNSFWALACADGSGLYRRQLRLIRFAQLMVLKETNVPAVYVGASR